MKKGNKPSSKITLATIVILVSAMMLASCGASNPADKGEIADSLQADLNKDGKAEEILLTGTKQENGDPYMHQISLGVKDGKTGQYSQASIGSNDVGYEPKLELGSFTGTNSQELLISVATGGSGGIMIYSLFQYEDNKIKPVVSQNELNKGLQLETTCLPDFLLSVEDKSTGYTAEIDLAKGIDDYVALGVYSQSGELLQEPMILVDGYSLMEGKDTNGDGIQELHGFQSISVGAHVNQVAIARSVWTVQGGTLKLIEEGVEPVPQE